MLCTKQDPGGAGYATCMRRDEKCIKYFVGNSEGQRSFGISRRRWTDNIKIRHCRCVLDSTREVSKWWALLHIVMNIGHNETWRISGLSEEMVGSQDGYSPM